MHLVKPYYKVYVHGLKGIQRFCLAGLTEGHIGLWKTEKSSCLTLLCWLLISFAAS